MGRMHNPPLALAALRMAPLASRISTPPICGRNLPPAVAASVMKKFGLALTRLARFNAVVRSFFSDYLK